MTSQRPKMILYLGGGFSQLAAITSLEAAGIRVGVTDMNADAPCRDIASRFAQVSATDLDGLCKLVAEWSKEMQICGIYGVADYAAASVFGLADKLGLKAPLGASARIFTDKAETSRLLSQAGIPVPELLWAGTSDEFPETEILAGMCGRSITVKAREGNNSKGVEILECADESAILAALAKAGKTSKKIMIEAFVPGRISNVDGLMIEGEYIPISTTMRRNDVEIPHICTAMIQPATWWDGFESEAFQISERIAAALDYRSGPFTADLIVDQSGNITVLEVSPHFHSISSDIVRGNGNPAAAYFAWLGGDRQWRRHLADEPASIGICCQHFVDKSGRIKTICGFDSLSAHPKITHVKQMAHVGDDISCSADDKDLAALIWAVADDDQELEEVLAEIASSIKIEVEPLVP